MKIKIIELFNRIANGEEVPEKIKWDNLIYVLKQDSIDGHFYYRREGTDYSVGNLFFSDLTMGDLNDEVEIIEEDKTIKELKTEFIGNNFSAKKIIEKNGKGYSIREVDNILINKINELVKEINKLKEN